MLKMQVKFRRSDGIDEITNDGFVYNEAVNIRDDFDDIRYSINFFLPIHSGLATY